MPGPPHLSLLASVTLVTLAILAMGPCRVNARAQRQGAPFNVVLVHGFLNDGRIFDPMVHALERQGYRCLAPSLRPNDCRHGVRALTLELARQIDARFGPAEPLVLIGFSMGGLVTRDYVQNVARRHRIQAVFLIATFHHGTGWASLAPRGSGVRDLAFNSAFVQALNRHERAWESIPVRSYRAPFDLMILPPGSSRWEVGTTRQLPCLFHPWLVRDKTLLADLLARLARLPAPR